MTRNKHNKDKKLHNSDEKLHNSNKPDLAWQETTNLLPEDEIEGGSGTILILIILIGILRVLLPLHLLQSSWGQQLLNCAFVRKVLSGTVCPVQIPAVFALSNHL